jgi:hypothetical protein
MAPRVPRLPETPLTFQGALPYPIANNVDDWGLQADEQARLPRRRGRPHMPIKQLLRRRPQPQRVHAA